MTRFPLSPRRIGHALLLTALAGSGGIAHAGLDAADAAAALAAAVPASKAAPTTSRSPFAAPVAGNRLGTSRGGTATSETLGEVRNTTATNVAGGANSVRDGSFANAAGLTTVIQNSGSNVLIQNSTTVNVQFRP